MTLLDGGMEIVKEKNDDLIKNGSGYIDMTAYKAIKNTDRVSSEDALRFHRLLDTFFYIADLAGFRIEGHIVLEDKKTGKVWR